MKDRESRELRTSSYELCLCPGWVLMRCSGELAEFGVHAAVFEALGHPGGCRAEVGLPVGMSLRVR